MYKVVISLNYSKVYYISAPTMITSFFRKRPKVYYTHYPFSIHKDPATCYLLKKILS